MSDNTLFGRWLKQRRRALDLTQERLAQQVGCAVITLQKIEAGSLRPSTHIAERLAERLDVPPEERASFVQAARAAAPATRAAPPSGAAARPRPAIGLPVAPTPLIGRSAELAAVQAYLLRSDVRLLTLVGAPGVGKTRLALQSAAELSDAFADGVGYVALAPVSDPDLVPATIARSLGVKEGSGQSLLDRLQEHLREQQLLLALDNFEQVIPATPQLAALLAAAPRLKLLITSRTALHISGEHEYLVPPLALPDLAALPSHAALAEQAAVELFVARARAVKPGFALTDANAPAVAAICVRLDGLPLAIELAAARSKLFSPQALLARLEQRLPLLTGGPQDLPDRQRTLHGAIEWGYQLLTAEEQALFARLSVFVGGCTLEATEAVCEDKKIRPALSGEGRQGDREIKPEDSFALSPGLPVSLSVLDGVAALLDKSLLQQRDDADGEPRFSMLATIHEYAAERLAARGETAALRQRHARYYLALAEAADVPLRGAQQPEWLERLTDEHGNLRAALEWSLAHDPAVALRLSAALWPFWHMRSHFAEGRRWLEQALSEQNRRAVDAACAGADRAQAGMLTCAVANAYRGAGVLAYRQSDYARAGELLELSLAHWRELGDKQGIAGTLNDLGNVAFDMSDLERTQALYEESLALRRELGDARGVAGSLSNLGILRMYKGDYSGATLLYEESLALDRELGDRVAVSIALNNLGIVALHQGQYGRANRLYEESLALKRELGEKGGMASTLSNLGEAALYQRDFQRAIQCFEESLALRRELGDRWGMASVLTNIGTAALYQGQYGRAAAILEESLAIKRALGDRWSIAISLDKLGLVALRLGDDARAIALQLESLALRHELADKPGIAQSLAGLAAAAANQGRAALAAQLWGAAEALRQAIGEPLPPLEQADHARDVALAQSRCEPATFAAAWAVGRALPLEQAIVRAGEVGD